MDLLGLNSCAKTRTDYGSGGIFPDALRGAAAVADHDAELDAFKPLQGLDHPKEISGLRIAGRTEHLHERLRRGPDVA